MKLFARRILSLALAVMFCLSAMVTFAADTATGITGNDNISATYDPAIMNGSGKNNLASYRAVNTDVRAWLRIPGTNINYPVLHDSSGRSNDGHYYLNRDLYGNSSRNGSIYASKPTTFGKASQLPRNTVLFGHNWTNYTTVPVVSRSSDVYFGQLPAFHYLNFAKSHPYIYYSTPDQEMVWVIFAAFYIEESYNYISPNPSDESFAAMIKNVKAHSRHNYDVAVGNTDKILTLSTCTRMFGPSNKQRFVVMARLLRDGETTATAPTITANPSPIAPKL